jgi:hypothetical protein
MEDGKKIGKLYGTGRSYETGPARGKAVDYQKIEQRGPKPSLETGPKRISSTEGKIGHKAGGNMTTGTKGDERGEDSAGSAPVKSNKVRGY